MRPRNWTPRPSPPRPPSLLWYVVWVLHIFFVLAVIIGILSGLNLLPSWAQEWVGQIGASLYAAVKQAANP